MPDVVSVTPAQVMAAKWLVEDARSRRTPIDPNIQRIAEALPVAVPTENGFAAALDEPTADDGPAHP